MKSIATFFTIGLFASIGLAGPTVRLSDEAGLETRGTASGCDYYAAPRCCVPTVCQCRDGRIYQVNQDAKNGGGHGCDPPWGLISDHPGSFPGYCC